MTTARRYPHMTLVDEEGVTVHFDLCKPCATVLADEGVIDGLAEMECPPVGYDEGYLCWRCHCRISLA
jgi:Zn-finger nucleic acid-binding protein